MLCFLNVSQDSLIVMVSLAFIACLENRTPMFTKPPTRFFFVYQRVTVFIGDGVRRESRALVSRCDKRQVQVCTLPKRYPFQSVSKGDFQFPLFFLLAFHAVRHAIIWKSPWKSMHSKEFGSKHFTTGSHASQQRMSVPRCMFP